MWLIAFTTVSQAVSWVSTLIVARLLVPADYGLMAMATILTGYVQVFYTMGIGSAIVQRREVTDDELSSVFWALLFWGTALGSLCFALAYPTVAIFDEPGLFRVTQAVSVLFILGTAVVVPSTLLKRDMRFKAVGLVTSTSVLVSCLSMILMAYLGAGVWTLLGGHIIRTAVELGMALAVTRWRPRLHFSHQETKPYLRFGLPLAGANSLNYLYRRSPDFFGGRAFSATGLGYYSMAIQLSHIPNDKILSVITSVAYPVFSKIQSDDWECRRFYLRLSQLVGFIVMPIYCGAFFVAGDVIPLVLGPQWEQTVLPFQILCLAMLVSTLARPNELINTAQGRPHWGFWFNLANALTMVPTFYVAATWGSPGYLAVPWLLLNAPAYVVFAGVTMRKIGVSPRALLEHLQAPLAATVTMLVVLVGLRYLFAPSVGLVPIAQIPYVAMIVLSGMTYYSAWLFLRERAFLNEILRLARA